MRVRQGYQGYSGKQEVRSYQEALNRKEVKKVSTVAEGGSDWSSAKDLLYLRETQPDILYITEMIVGNTDWGEFCTNYLIQHQSIQILATIIFDTYRLSPRYHNSTIMNTNTANSISSCREMSLTLTRKLTLPNNRIQHKPYRLTSEIDSRGTQWRVKVPYCDVMM